MKRFAFLASILCAPLFLFSQLQGDITNDNIVDANDYVYLREMIFGEKPAQSFADINEDLHFDVLDLFFMENFLYHNGEEPPGKPSEKWDKVRLYYGRFHEENKSLEIYLENKEEVGAIEFEISGVGNILGQFGGAIDKFGWSHHIRENKLIFYRGSGKLIPKGKWILTNLQIQNAYYYESCLLNPIIGNALAQPTQIEIGECTNNTATLAGYEELKKIILGDLPENDKSDVNHDGNVDIADLMVIENFLFRNGPPPPGEDGIFPKSKVKLEIDSVDLDQKSFEISMQNSEEVSSFQFKIEGINTIVSMESSITKKLGLEVHKRGTTIYCFRGEGKSLLNLEEPLLKIVYDTNVAANGCLIEPVVINSTSNTYHVKLGECVNLIPHIFGCMDPKALNFNSSANTADGSCTYPAPEPKPEAETPLAKQEAEAKKVNAPPLNNQDISEQKNSETKEALLRQKEIEKEQHRLLSEQKKEESLQVKEQQELLKETKRQEKELEQQLAEQERLEEEHIKEEEQETKGKGLGVPMISSGSRLKMQAAKGNMVYDITEKAYYYFNGSIWIRIGNADQNTLSKPISLENR